MFVVLGASGNTGKVVAETLLTQKKKVRVVLRDAAKGQAWKASCRPSSRRSRRNEVGGQSGRVTRAVVALYDGALASPVLDADAGGAAAAGFAVEQLLEVTAPSSSRRARRR
jgi:uncharacterized protein YbjT (DUF2867 family)